MCGIVGIIQKETTNIGKIIVECLLKLEYRGYDSVGIAVIKDEDIIITKDEGKIAEVIEKTNILRLKGKIAIGHTRWATHGPPSKENAHPHTDCTGKISVVHNGIIENFQRLKKELKENGHVFKSETDTEVIPHLIEDMLKKGAKSFKEAVIAAIEKLEGTYAIAVISPLVPNTIFCAKKDSPLVIGVNSNRMFCASDIPAFLSETQSVVLLHDEEFVTLTPEGYEIINIRNRQRINRKPYTVSWKPEMAQKAGFPHFMLKEIHEQPNVLADYIRIRQKSVNEIAEAILNSEKVVFIGAGTAYHSTLTGEFLIRKYTRKPCMSVIASEYNAIAPLVDEKTVMIPVSQSGETMDTITAIKDAKQKGAKILSVVNVVGSTITRHSDAVVYLYAGPEIGVAATKTYLAQTIAMWDIALEVGKRTGAILNNEYNKYREQFDLIPNAVKETIQSSEIISTQIAKWFANKKSSFYLGRGINLQTAMEGALKMKEISYIHSEAYPAGESKHGPIALIEEDFPVVFVVPRDNTHKNIIGNIMEMKARGAKIITVTEENDKEVKELATWSFDIPKGYSEAFSTILYVVPLQLLAYYTAVKKGLDPDKPRNLAKSVTVL